MSLETANGRSLRPIKPARKGCQAQPGQFERCDQTLIDAYRPMRTLPDISLDDQECLALHQISLYPIKADSKARRLCKELSLTRDDIIGRLVPLMENVFDTDDLVYSDALTADDIAEWDSLSHIRFVVATERAFNVRFSPSEIEGFKNVGELVSAVQAKTGD